MTDFPTLNRIQQVGHRNAWKCPISFDGPKYYHKKAVRYNRERFGNYVSTESFVDDHSRLETKEFFLQSRHSIQSIFSEDTDIDRKKLHSDTGTSSETNFAAPISSSEIWSSQGTCKPVLQSRLKEQTNFVKEVLTFAANKSQCLELWTSMTSQERVKTFKHAFGQMTCNSGPCAPSVSLFSLCLQPFCINTVQRGIEDCEKVEAIFLKMLEMGGPYWTHSLSPDISGQSKSREDLVNIDQCVHLVTDLSLFQFLLFVIYFSTSNATLTQVLLISS